MKIELSKIDPLPSDYFLPEYHATRTNFYFWCKISNGIVDTGHIDHFKPVGMTTEKRICGKHDVAIMFETKDGDKTWFHLEFD